MAASDATYRKTRTLNIIFAASSVVMLLTIIAMFAEDYFRDWKIEQRLFYDVEEEMAKREVLAAAPGEEKLEEIKKRETALREKKEELKLRRAQFEKELGELAPRKTKAETERAGIKADVDSIKSLYDIAVEHHPDGTASEEAQAYKKKLDETQVKLNEKTQEVEK